MLKRILPLIPVSIFLILALLLNSCSKNSGKPEDRAAARWQALIELDWEKAYSYETPSYKLASTIEDYEKSFGTAITWISAKTISSKEVSEKVIDVDVELTIEFSEGGGKMLIPSVFTERWLKVDNTWWHVMKE